MNRFVGRNFGEGFKVLSILALISLFPFLAGAQSRHSLGFAEPSDVQTYSESVLHAFGDIPDGAQPLVGLVEDGAGNLYGGTNTGGAYTFGSVFELSPNGSGGYTYNLLYSLTGGVEGGFLTSLSIDSNANLYGTTSLGSSQANAYGTVFELSKGLDGTWILSNAYGFTGTTDGERPQAGLVVDSAGNVYGTALGGGTSSVGTVFELQLSNNQWSEQTLHAFSGTDGAYPYSGLLVDKAGNLYGTTTGGGTGNQGVLFKLHKTANQGWVETVLHNFTGGASDGVSPSGNLIFDRAGNIYGTAAAGLQPIGLCCGGVFKLTRSGQITWLYAFTGGADGSGPQSGVTFDKEGNLYGNTGTGGGGIAEWCGSGAPVSGCGVVFKLTPSLGNQTTPWTESVLDTFTGGADGDGPLGTLLFDNAGNLYGTTVYGGINYGLNGFGVVFELKANPVATTTTITRNTPNPSKTWQAVTVGFAVVRTVAGNSKPTGTVTVNASTGEGCIAALRANGKSSCKLEFSSAGARTLTATYSGDGGNQSSVSTGVAQSVLNSTTTVITKNAPDPAKVGRLVTVHFSVDAKDATKQTKPTGSVTVNASSGESCSGTLLPGGEGRCQLVFNSVGSRTLIATYGGDADNQGSASIAAAETVN